MNDIRNKRGFEWPRSTLHSDQVWNSGTQNNDLRLQADFMAHSQFSFPFNESLQFQTWLQETSRQDNRKWNIRQTSQLVLNSVNVCAPH